MRFKLLSKLLIAMPVLAISMPAIAGYQVTAQPGDGSAAEVISTQTQDPGTFLVVADIQGSVSAQVVGLTVGGDATLTDDYTLTFPATCPINGGGSSITFSASSTGANTFDLNLGTPGGGGAISGSGVFTCTITIDVEDDAVDEDSEALSLTLSGDSNVVKNPKVQVVNIGDNDTAALVATNTSWNGTDAIVLSQKLTNEDGGTDNFFVELATEPSGNVTVDLAVSDDTEALISSGGSGDQATLELTFTPGNWDAGQEVTITGQDDNPAVQDGNANYTVTVVTTTEADTKYNGLATGPVNGVNADNDEGPGQLRFTTSAQSGDEADAMTLTVERINGTTGEVEVDYAITAGTASASDYNDTTASTTLTFGDGITSQDITITLVDDTLWEPSTEDFTVTLSNPTNGASILAPNPQTISINPSDPIDIAISAASPALAPEGNTGDPQVPVTFSVTYSGGTLESPMTISWMTVDGSATGGVDYDSVAATDFDLPVNGDAVDLTVNVNGDDDPEGDETFSVQLSESFDLVSLTGGGSSVGTIQDDDASDDGTFSITSIAPNPVMESAGTVTVTVSRIGNTVNSAATINYATADGSAVEPGDYTSTAGSLVWALDDADASKTFDIPILDDADGESDETFTVSISAAASEVIGISSGEVTIIGDPTVALSPDSYLVSEDGGSVTVFVTRTQVDDQAVSVDYTTTDGTAIAGEDYTTTSGTLDWTAADLSTMSFDVPILADVDEIGPEAFTVDLSSCTNCTITTAQATVTIEEGVVQETTPGTIAFNPVSVSVGEATGSAGLLVGRSGGSDGVVKIDWATVPGSATSPDDFTAASGTLTWADGAIGNFTILVPIIDDGDVEPTESFTVELSNPRSVDGTPPDVGADVGTIEITDNDSDTPGQFRVIPINVVEDAGVANVSVSRDVGSSGAVSVTYETVSGTATGDNPANPATDDYLYTTGVLNWADGDATAKVIPITIVDDAEIETEEMFAVTLSAPTGGATIDIGSSNVTIFDNDGGGDFSISDITVTEGLDATVTVTRSGGNGTAAFITWETQDGTAEDENGDGDYIADNSNISGELTWLDGDVSTTREITITTVADANVEGSEWFSVTLVGAQGESVSISKPDGIITIVDPVAIPTLNQWAMALLALLLLGLGVYSMPVRNRARLTRK